jgi:hypothetical protein
MDKKAKLFLFFLLTLFFHWQVFLFQSSGFSVFKRFSSLQALLQSKLECLPFFLAGSIYEDVIKLFTAVIDECSQ